MSSAESLIKGPRLKINSLKLKSIAITNINTDEPAALLCAAGQGLFLRLGGGTLQPGWGAGWQEGATGSFAQLHLATWLSPPT